VSLQFFNLRHVKNIIFSYNNNGKAQDKAIQDKIDDLTSAVERLKHLQAHDALVILKNSLAIPMLLYQETFEDPFIPLFLPFVTFSSDHHRKPGSNRHCVLAVFFVTYGTLKMSFLVIITIMAFSDTVVYAILLHDCLLKEEG